MSPWWNKFLPPPSDVLITSDEIVLAQGGIRIPAAVPNSPLIGDPFEVRLAQPLKAVMEQASRSNARSANIWLCHSLVPQSVVEIDARAMSNSDISALLKAYWEDALDLSAATLALSYQVQPSGRSIVSSCCSLALIDAIQANLRLSGWTARRIAPQLAKTWNENRRQIHNKDCCLLILQDKVLSIGVYQKGSWIAWTSEGCNTAEWAELSNRITRFCRSTGLCDANALPVWIYAPQATSKPSSVGLNNWSLLAAPSHAGFLA